jgi:acetate kinase
LSADQLRDLVNRESGILGLSGISADMRELLARRQDPAAEEAIASFCYSARKFIAALAAALGGLETLVFTAGIGERSAPIRERICADLGWLGIELDRGRNEANEAVISSAGSRVVVRVMKTNEELMIARHTQRVLGG